MPYCLACGTKTDFEAVDCPSCGEAISQRIGVPYDVNDGEEHPQATGDEQINEWVAASEDEEASTGEDPGGDETAAREVTTRPDGPSPFADTSALPFAIEQPVRGDWNPVILGAVVQFFAHLFLFPALFTVGYAVRLARAVARGQTARPAFTDYGQLLADGLKALLVAGVYGTVLLVGAIAAAVVGVVDEPLGIALWIVVALVGLYPFPASLTVYAATDDARAAFSRRYAGALCTSWAYLQTWLLGLVCLGVLGVVAAVSAVSVVGPFAVEAWGLAMLAALWGYHYRGAVSAGVVPPAPDEPVA